MKVIRLIRQYEYNDILYPTHTDDPDNIYGKNTTVGTSGCGLCSVMMVAELLSDKKITIYDAINLSFDSSANHATGTNMRLLAPFFC